MTRQNRIKKLKANSQQHYFSSWNTALDFLLSLKTSPYKWTYLEGNTIYYIV